MRIRKLVLIVFVCSISASAQVRGTRRVANPVHIPASAVENAGVNKLPIRRVILYSNGVAYIEHGHQYDPFCATEHVMAPLSPLDPRRVARGVSEVLLRFGGRPTRVDHATGSTVRPPSTVKQRRIR